MIWKRLICLSISNTFRDVTKCLWAQREIRLLEVKKNNYKDKENEPRTFQLKKRWQTNPLYKILRGKKSETLLWLQNEMKTFIKYRICFRKKLNLSIKINVSIQSGMQGDFCQDWRNVLFVSEIIIKTLVYGCQCAEWLPASQSLPLILLISGFLKMQHWNWLLC